MVVFCFPGMVDGCMSTVCTRASLR